MRKCLALISVLLLVWLCPATGQAEDTVTQYGVVIDVGGKQQITGLCVVSHADDGNVVGTIVNEFGMKAFDFTFNGKKAKLMNVFKPINKWYIRRVLSKDIAFFLSHANATASVADGKRQLTVSPDGAVTLTNNRNITYTFSPLDEQ